MATTCAAHFLCGRQPGSHRKRPAKHVITHSRDVMPWVSALRTINTIDFSIVWSSLLLASETCEEWDMSAAAIERQRLLHAVPTQKLYVRTIRRPRNNNQTHKKRAPKLKPAPTRKELCFVSLNRTTNKTLDRRLKNREWTQKLYSHRKEPPANIRMKREVGGNTA